MYSRNCGKSRTDINCANVIRHCQHAGRTGRLGIQIMCDFQIQRWMQSVLLEVHKYRHDSVYPDCFGLEDDSAIYCISCSGATSCHKDSFGVTACVKIRLPRIFLAKTTCALKTPPRNAAFSPLLSLIQPTISTPSNS